MVAEAQITDLELADLVRCMDEVADAYIRGDLHRYLSLFEHGQDYTLMAPYGGPTTHGFEYTEEGAAATSRFFASGEATFELQLVHRHVDPLVQQIPFQHCAQLARGLET